MMEWCSIFGVQVVYVTVSQSMTVLPDGTVFHTWIDRWLCSLMERCSIFGAQVTSLLQHHTWIHRCRMWYNNPVYTCGHWWSGPPDDDWMYRCHMFADERCSQVHRGSGGSQSTYLRVCVFVCMCVHMTHTVYMRVCVLLSLKKLIVGQAPGT